MRSTRWLIAVVLPLLACSSNGGSTPGDAGDGDGGASPCGVPDPALAALDAAAVFGAPAVPTFDFHLPPESWAWLQAHAQEEIYVEAEGCYNGRGLGKVGLRFKGSYGSLYSCYNDQGEKTCRKVGMKVKFDKYVDGQRFAGLKRLNFQGYRWDDSYLKERLSYDLYRAMGIVAPRAAWAKLRVNGEEQGLFGMVEQIDGPFTKDRFPGNGDGNLYKEAWPGRGDAAFLASRLETNTSAPNVAAYQAFSAALVAAPPEQARAVLDTYMDPDYLGRYLAVDDAIANFDGIITYYTQGAPDLAGNHNFFIYEQGPHAFTLIPWDLESTLSLTSNYGNVPPWQVQPVDCTLTYPVWSGQQQVIAPGCDRVFQAVAANLSAYKVAAQTLLDTHFSQETMEANIATWASFIAAEAAADPHGPGQVEFEKAVGYLRQALPRLRARLEHLMTGTMSVPLTFASAGVNDFEAMDAYSLMSGTGQMSNPNTTFGTELNTDDPLSGTKSCRVQFSYGNEAGPYQQWMSYMVPMSVIPTDATALTGIRLLLRSNVSRAVRLDLDSPNNPAAMKGVRRGWDVVVGPVAQTVEVKFAEARVQSWGGVVEDSLPLILSTISGLIFQPQCVGRDSTGQLPAGVRDTGWIDVDDVAFF